MSKQKIVVLYDRVLVDDDESSAPADKSPVTRTLDKKEVEEEVAEALVKLGHALTSLRSAQSAGADVGTLIALIEQVMASLL